MHAAEKLMICEPVDVLLSVICASSPGVCCESPGAVYKPHKDTWTEKSIC